MFRAAYASVVENTVQSDLQKGLLSARLAALAHYKKTFF
jgi:hypothetical protein